MQTQFARNIHFTKHIKANGRVREFNFRKIPSQDEQLFHVDVSDDRGNRLIFRMQKSNNDQWRLINLGLPQWVHDAEGKLGELIDDEMKQLA